VTNPKAASGVSMGLNLKILGSNNPSPPKSSAIPIKRMSASGASAAKGREAANSCIGVMVFGSPAMINIAARIICAIHKEIFNPFVVLFIVVAIIK